MDFQNSETTESSNLIVGTNSYVTAEEATQYVRMYYPEDAHLYSLWMSLSLQAKEVALLRSAQVLESLPYIGRKAVKTQEMAFPRIFHAGESAITPEGVKLAQVENALYLCNPDNYSEEKVQDVEYYNWLRASGVSSYKIGNLSESIGESNSQGGFSYSGAHQEKTLDSPQAQMFIAPYIARCASII